MTVQEAIEAGFRWIEGYEGHYMVDAIGNIYSSKRKRLMTPCKSNHGYMQVHLSKNGTMKSHKIHRLVAKAFISNPLNLPQVNHKDENKENNCVDNLEWCTQTYNMNYQNGQKRRALSRNYDDISKKRSDAQSKEVTQYDYEGRIVAIWRNAYVAEQHGYNRSMINQCCLGNKKSHSGYIWKYTDNMEKQIPKKVIFEDNGEVLLCPRCGLDLMGSITEPDHDPYYCFECGQALDWGEEE